MSKTSYFLIAVMTVGLLFIMAMRGYRWYEARAEQEESERMNSTESFTFQHVPMSMAAPEPDIPSAPVPFETLIKTQDVFLEEQPLTPEAEVKQAKETISSIVQDYQSKPELKQFNQDLARATNGQAVDLKSISQGDISKLMKQNPQIQEVVSKHMQNPEFAKTVQQILTNPQFVQSVRQLQKRGVSVPVPAQQKTGKQTR